MLFKWVRIVHVKMTTDLLQDTLLNLHEVHRSRNFNQESIFSKIIFVEILRNIRR